MQSEVNAAERKGDSQSCVAGGLGEREICCEI